MKTVDEIYREMADRFAQETGMELAGTGEMAVRLYALAAQVYGLYQESAWTRKQCFPQTATGEELDKHGALRGITRNGASKAAGSLRFSIQAAGTEDLKERALARGVLLRACGNYHGLGSDWYRVCVGGREQNRRLLAALKEAL